MIIQGIGNKVLFRIYYLPTDLSSAISSYLFMSPFQGFVSYDVMITGLHPVLVYAALSGLTFLLSDVVAL